MEDNFQVCFTPSGRQFKGEFGDTLLQVAQDAGVAIRSLCGGYGQCHQCWIEVSEGDHSKFGVKCEPDNISALTRLEKQLINDNPNYKGKRLACQSCIQGDLVIDVPEESQEHKAYISKKNKAQNYSIASSINLIDCSLEKATLDKNPSASENLISQLAKKGINANIDFTLLRELQPLIHETKGNLTVAVRDNNQIVAAYPQGKHQVLGAAIDIGSTTLALYIYDLNDGKLGTKITEMLHEACENLEVDWNKLLEVVLVGNPIMHHIFFGISPVELGQAPFTLSIRGWISIYIQKQDCHSYH